MLFKAGTFSLNTIRFDRIYALYMGLSPREQVIALAGAGGVLFLLLVLPVMVASNTIKGLERSITQQNKDFGEVVRAADEYHVQQAKLAGIEKTLSGGYDSALSSTMEALATKVGVRDRIDSLKESIGTGGPSDVLEQASVDVRLKRVSFKALMQLLYEIESQPDKLLRIDKLDIRPRFDNRQEMDASFVVSTYRLQQEGSE